MKIPEYDQNVSLASPGAAPTISAEAAAAPWLGLAKVGEQTMELGKVIQDKQDEIYRVKELSDRTIQAEKETSDLRTSIQQERDPQTAEQRFSEGFAEIKNRTMDGVNDYKVANALTNHLTGREVSGITEVRHEKMIWTIERGQASTLQFTDESVKRASAPGATFDDLFREQNMFSSRMAADVRTGLWGEKAAYELTQKVKKEYATNYVSMLIDRDADTALAVMSMVPGFQDLLPTEQEALQKRATAAANQKDTKSEREFKDASGDALNQLLIGIQAGDVPRYHLNEFIGQGMMTDEHERIALNAMRQKEEDDRTGKSSDPKVTSDWAMDVDSAMLRRDAGTLSRYLKNIRNDDRLAPADKAKLYAETATKLDAIKRENLTTPGFDKARSVLDRHFEFNAMTGMIKSSSKQREFEKSLRDLNDAAYGMRRDGKTGEVMKIAPMRGWELEDYAQKLIGDYEESQRVKRERASKEAPLELPGSKSSPKGRK